MGLRKKKEDQPKPEPVKVPTRGVLLNKWATRQDKLKQLVDQVAAIKAELVGIAHDLHTHYGVLVSDTTHNTVTSPKSVAPVEAKAEFPVTDPVPDEEPTELLPVEKNLLARSPTPIIGTPTTAPLTEQQVDEIRKGSELGQGATAPDLSESVGGRMDQIARMGFGKQTGG